MARERNQRIREDSINHRALPFTLAKSSRPNASLRMDPLFRSNNHRSADHSDPHVQSKPVNNLFIEWLRSRDLKKSSGLTFFSGRLVIGHYMYAPTPWNVSIVLIRINPGSRNNISRPHRSIARKKKKKRWKMCLRSKAVETREIHWEILSHNQIDYPSKLALDGSHFRRSQGQRGLRMWWGSRDQQLTRFAQRNVIAYVISCTCWRDKTASSNYTPIALTRKLLAPPTSNYVPVNFLCKTATADITRRIRTDGWS